MRRLVVSIAIMLCICMSYAQEPSEGTGPGLPNVVPVSPEAASLGKYGDIPVNLATGRINYTIPIFTIKEGGMQLPIYLSYNHSGLMAEEDPGVAGLGWTLHAGGMIIRQLRGKPDEGVLGYLKANIGKDWVIPYKFNEWNDLSGEERKNKIFNLIDGATTGRLDTQPDKYVINAGGLSGNFSYNELGAPIFYPHKNYNVAQDNGYTITDDNGIQYEFEIKEITTTESVPAPEMTYVSGWHLTKIISPISDRTIDLSYTQGANYQKESYSESREVIVSNITNLRRCNVNTANQKSLTITNVAKQQLSRIDFSEGSILFDIRAVPSGSKSRSKNYLHAISIQDRRGKVVQRFEFVFDDLLSNFKLLTEIKKYGSNGAQIPFYKLEYNGTPPTSIEYTKQDSWGYYNGKGNNSLISGDRSVDFEKSSLGALTKIVYPTQGYTKIAYESNKVPLLGNFFLVGGQRFTTPINKTESIYATSFNNPSPANKTITFKADQTIKVRMEANTGGRGSAEAFADISSSGGSLRCNPHTGNCTTSVSSTIENGDSNDDVNNVVSYFEVKKGTTLILSARASGTFATGTARITVDYYDPDLITPENNFVKVGGIRVASTTDCASSGDCISKDYKYVQEDGISSGKILSNPIYSHIYFITEGTRPCTIRKYSATSKVPLASFQGAPALYNRVETLFNGNDNNGKTVQYFSYELNTPVEFPFPPNNPKDWRKGNLIKEEVFKNKAGVMELVRTTENTYQTHYPFPIGAASKKQSIGFVAGRLTYEYHGIESGEALVIGNPSHYREKLFDNRPEFYHLKNSKVTSYFNGKPHEVITNYTHYAHTGYVKEQTTIDSKGEQLKSELTYPTVGRLFTQNRIAVPINTKNYYKDTIKLSEQHTYYKDFEGGLHMPERIQVGKLNQSLEDRIVYHKYDSKGNPLEVSKKDGTKIYYVWGYKSTQPIAKIEHYTSMTNNQQSIINTAIITSNLDIDSTTENNLRVALNNIRTAFPKAMVTTFTYDPLIGATSITDPRGETMYYQYDNFNRLKFIKDAQGNILKEHKYNYKN